MTRTPSNPSPRVWGDDQFRALLESAPDAMIVVDESGTIVFANDQVEVLFGYSTDELHGQAVEILLPESLRLTHPALRRSFCRNPSVRHMGAGLDLFALHKLGHEFSVEISLSPIPTPNGLLVSSAIRDATQHRDKEEELEAQVASRTALLQRTLQQQERVAELGRKALEGLPLQALMEEAVASVAEALDAELCKVLELLPDERSLLLRAGTGWKEGLVGHARVSAALDSQAGFTLASNGPVMVRDLTAETRFSGPALLVEHGVVSGISVVIYDTPRSFGVLGVHTRTLREFTREDGHFVQEVAYVIGDAVVRTRLDRKVQEQKALTMLGQMAASVAHDLKNPLAGISGAVGVIRDKLPAGAGDRELLDLVLERVKGLTQSIDDTLSFARHRVPHKEPVSIRAVVDRSLGLLRNDPANSRVAISVVGEDSIVPVDVYQIDSAFTNVLTNAVQAMRGEGILTVRLGSSSGFAQVTFTDSGPGIRADVRERAFEPFFSTKTRGTGLGLASARRVVEDHGGEIRIDCPETGGTSVVFDLPLA